MVWGMDNADLIKLKKADFSDETIIHTIDKETPDYDTSPSALVALKNAGVSEAVINHVLTRQGNAPAVEAPPPAAASAASFPAPVDNSSPAVAAGTPSSAPVAVAGPVEPNLFNIESPSIAPPLEEVVSDHDYFTRFSFREEGSTYLTTNYARGTLIPINTPVHVTAISKRKIALKRLDNGEPIYIDNVEKYSRKTTAQFASVLLSSAKTPIERLAPPLSSAIAAGELRKGMTKEQALMARGYPPAHETPSTDDDRWKYWSSRFVTQTIVFTNGRLTEGREIP